MTMEGKSTFVGVRRVERPLNVCDLTGEFLVYQFV